MAQHESSAHPHDGHRADGADMQILIGISFPDTFRAQEFLTAAMRLASTGMLVLRDAVLVAKDDNGHTSVRETTDPQPLPTAISGALWAGLFGLLLGGPVGWLAGVAVGASGGAIAAKAIDVGITDEWVEWFRAAVEPGHTVLALLADDVNRVALAQELARFPQGHIVYTNLSSDWMQRLQPGSTPPAPDTTAEPDGSGWVTPAGADEHR